MILQVYGSSFATLGSFDVPQIGGLKMMAGYEGKNHGDRQPIPSPTYPPRNKALIRPDLGKPMVYKGLIRVYFWGGVRYRGGLVD